MQLARVQFVLGLALTACVAACTQETGSQQDAGSAASIAGAGAGGVVGGAAGMPVVADAALPPAAAGSNAPPTTADAAVPRDASAPLDAQPPRADASPASDAGADAAPAPDAAAPDDDRCGVAVLDPSQPPRALDVGGDLGTHDPTLIEQDGVFYLWQTGPRLPGKTSTDLMQWRAAPGALGASNPAWVRSEVPEATDLWAPDVSNFGGRFHLYYSASSFGSNYSCIGHAVRDSLASGSWSDQGSVVCSNHGSQDDFNTIDPNVIVDTEGTPWLAFGSFWSGIKIVRLDLDGARADDEIHAIASRGGGAIEAPVIVRRCGYYYLFVSFDRCCAGVDSTYNVRVGRSQNVLGPYVDAEGRAMMQGGGTLLVGGAGRWHGPGHNAVIFSGDRAYNVFHAYDAEDSGRSRLRVAELAWNADGWPVSGGP